jgi:hypothetical protein
MRADVFWLLPDQNCCCKNVALTGYQNSRIVELRSWNVNLLHSEIKRLHLTYDGLFFFE